MGLGCCLWHPELATGFEGRGAACAGILSRVRARRWWGWWRSPVLAKLGCCSCHGNAGGLPSWSLQPNRSGGRGACRAGCAPHHLPWALAPRCTPKLHSTPLLPKLTIPPIFQLKDPGEKHWVFHRKKHLWVKKNVSKPIAGSRQPSRRCRQPPAFLCPVLKSSRLAEAGVKAVGRVWPTAIPCRMLAGLFPVGRDLLGRWAVRGWGWRCSQLCSPFVQRWLDLSRKVTSPFCHHPWPC